MITGIRRGDNVYGRVHNSRIGNIKLSRSFGDAEWGEGGGGGEGAQNKFKRIHIWFYSL